MKPKKPLPKIAIQQIEQCDKMIAINKRRLERCKKEPKTLSSEAGILTPIGMLAEKYKKAIKEWKREKRKILKKWAKRGYDVSEYETKRK